MRGRYHLAKSTPRTLRSSSKSGEIGLQRRVSQVYPISNHNLTLLVLGVGNLQPNRGEDEQDVVLEVDKDVPWRGLLEENWLLKPWSEVSAARANKVNLGMALREYMRRAWGKIFFLFLFSPSNSNLFR